MKFLCLIVIMLLVAACQGESALVLEGPPSSENEDQQQSSQDSPETFDSLDLVMSAYRSYRPSQWAPYRGASPLQASFEVPLSIPVLQGNAGTGWVSLILGERKFCYQGNASDNRSDDGDQFVLQYEKPWPDSECFNFSDKIPLQGQVMIREQETLYLNVDGGGCHIPSGTCQKTEVELAL